MYELINAKGDTYYIESPSKIGLVKVGEAEVCLVDSGNDKDAGKRIARIIEENGWTLKAIYTTHSHADHIGGCRYLQERFGCKVYSHGIQRGFAEAPLLMPGFLYGGDPPKELRGKFLVAQSFEVTPLKCEDLPEGWEMTVLSGHTSDMVGYKTRDGVLFLGDALLGHDVLEKHPVSYVAEIGTYLDTLETVKTLKADLYIPSHSVMLTEIEDLAEYNISVVHSVGDKLAELCKEPLIFEELLKKVFEVYEIPMNMVQHELIGSTVRSYLTWLSGTGRVHSEFRDNMLYWTV